jgi:hypothetical protein
MLYFKSKKIAVVSSRDGYIIGYNIMVEKEKSKSGKKEYYISSKSKDLADYPQT